MNQSKIAVRYAKAFFQVAQEKNILEELRKDVDLIASLGTEKEFGLLLESPVIRISQKKVAFQNIFKGKVNALTLQFLDMIADNKREVYILDICRNFNGRFMELKGIKPAKVTTASPLDKEQKEKISQTIAELFNTQVELTTEENSELIGGFVLRVGDQQIDASVSSKLRRLERDLLNTTL